MSTQSKKSSANDFEKKFRTDVAIKTAADRCRKPLLLSSQRFNKIVSKVTVHSSKFLADEQEEERKRGEQLKLDSDKLVAEFKGNMQRTQEQKVQQIKGQREKKVKQAIAYYEQVKENEQQKRLEKIARAEQIKERLKPGPRELHRAVLQSEVLQARNVQRAVNEEFEKAVAKQEQETKLRNEHALNLIEKDQQRFNECQINTVAYKKELLYTINENQISRSEQKKEIIKEQQATREAIDVETRAEIEKQKAAVEKKKAAMRNNALEAMKMMEQRRLRDRLVDSVETCLCCVHNAGKSQLHAQITKQNQELADKQQLHIEAEVQKLNNLRENSASLAAERIRRDITTKQLTFTAEEQQKVRKDRAAKQARIEAYLREMQKQKERLLVIEEEKRFEKAQSLKNAEVNCLFAEQQREQKLAQVQRVREQLEQQMEHNKKYKKTQKAAAPSCSPQTQDPEHTFFFEYAQNLMEDAKQKGRPLYPFVKAINNYKRENYINNLHQINTNSPSNVCSGENSIQLRSTSEKRNEKEKQNSTSNSVLRNCFKINEIVKMTSGPANINITWEKQSSARGKEHNALTLHYSREELNKLNQIARP